MDGRGRALDNTFVEQLWRTVKYEEVYLHDYQSMWDIRHSLARYVGFYKERLHLALGYRTPAAVYLAREMGRPHAEHRTREKNRLQRGPHS